MVILQENGFIAKICSECDGRNTETGERTLESVPSREGSSVSPSFTAINDQSVATSVLRFKTYARAQGSFAGVPADAANFFGSKPVRLGRGAIVDDCNARCEVLLYEYLQD